MNLKREARYKKVQARLTPERIAAAKRAAMMDMEWKGIDKETPDRLKELEDLVRHKLGIRKNKPVSQDGSLSVGSVFTHDTHKL